MSDPAETYDPRRFQTTVPYYTRYRLVYLDLLIRRIIELVGLKPGDAVMDLGCGPGLVGIPFAQAGMIVTGVDPEPAMLEAAREAARDTGVPLDLRQGSSFDLPKDMGHFKLVTMGRSFHWMDREQTLRSLDGLVAASGAVSLLHDIPIKTAENQWRRMLDDLADGYGRQDCAPMRAFNSPDHRAHESVLMTSAFSNLERASVFLRRTLTADDIVGFALSLSVCSPQKLGDKKDQFERELRAKLAELSPEGGFEEIAEMTAIIATRP